MWLLRVKDLLDRHGSDCVFSIPSLPPWISRCCTTVIAIFILFRQPGCFVVLPQRNRHRRLRHGRRRRSCTDCCSRNLQPFSQSSNVGFLHTYPFLLETIGLVSRQNVDIDDSLKVVASSLRNDAFTPVFLPSPRLHNVQDIAQGGEPKNFWRSYLQRRQFSRLSQQVCREAPPGDMIESR